MTDGRPPDAFLSTGDDLSTIDPDRLEHVAWGALYATAEEARDRYENLLRADEATR